MTLLNTQTAHNETVSAVRIVSSGYPENLEFDRSGCLTVNGCGMLTNDNYIWSFLSQQVHNQMKEFFDVCVGILYTVNTLAGIVN
jgi:hypothetical protein